MARPKNPMGDPVRIYTVGQYLKVRYYPSGVITSPQDRVRLDGRWLASSDVESREAHEVAARLRAGLLDFRAAHGLGAERDPQRVTVRAAKRALLERMAEDLTPTGTIRTRRSQLNVNIPLDCLDEPVESLAGRGDDIVRATRSAVKRDGSTKSDNTVSGSLSALAVFGAFVSTTYQMIDPFKCFLAVAENPVKEKRVQALAKVHRAAPTFRDSGSNDAIDPKQVPTYEEIAALRRAIIRRETQGPPGRPAHGRGSRGGAPVLRLEVARALANSVIFAASSGLRGCEQLGTHTSRVDVARGTIVVDRQLDRYKPWMAGMDPPLVPPKHNIEREVIVWSSFNEGLREMVDYADSENNGWIVAPTRRQRDWAKGYCDVITRASEQMAFEFAQAEAAGEDTTGLYVWSHKMHWLRHFYASESLAPVSANGLGWSLGLVQRNLGHQSEATTERIYRHITKRERDAARQVPHIWPGL